MVSNVLLIIDGINGNLYLYFNDFVVVDITD